MIRINQVRVINQIKVSSEDWKLDRGTTDEEALLSGKRVKEKLLDKVFLTDPDPKGVNVMYDIGANVNINWIVLSSTVNAFRVREVNSANDV